MKRRVLAGLTVLQDVLDYLISADLVTRLRIHFLWETYS